MLRKSPLASAIGVAIAGGSLVIASQSVAQQGEVEEIIATGTRIRADVYTSSTPMDVITAEFAAVRGIADVGTLLQTATVAAGSPQVTAASSTAFVEDGGTGVRTLSLRGLGANRTLVLLNNRRAGPAGVRGSVSAFDLNVLPLSVVDRIDILKDGSSSIYGSDAIAGVVNIHTRRDDGGTIDGYVTQPSRSGGEESRVSLSWGQTYSRGRFRVAGDHYREHELTKGDREYFRCGEQYIFDQNTGQRGDTIDPRTGRPWCNDLRWGHVWIYDYQDEGGNVPGGAKAQYDYDGDLASYVPALQPDPNDPDQMAVPPGWFLVNYDRPSDGVTNANHPFVAAQSLIPKLERSTVFGEGDFQFNDRVQGYAEVLLNRRKTTANSYRQFWSYIYSENYGFGFDEDDELTLLPGGGNPLSAGWQGRQWLSPTPVTDHSGTTVEIDYQRYVLGLSGDLGRNWFWDVSYQYSRSDGDYANDQIYDDAIWAQNFLDFPCEGIPLKEILDAFYPDEYPNARDVPCVDVPWLDPEFLRGNISPQIRNFLFARETGNTKYTQQSVEGFVSGVIGQVPAGRVGAAFGAQFTKDEIRDVPGDITLAGNAWGASSAGITAGKDETIALFGEIQLPLLAGKTAVDFLGLNLSARYTDVDSYGSDNTYKIGLNWDIVPSVRVRANRGTSFRSPALFELYLADQTSFASQRSIDPCINWGTAVDGGTISERTAQNCAAHGIAPNFPGGAITATVIRRGGLGLLEAETSRSSTVGVVWQPTFANLSVSLDYFDIELNDEVAVLGASTIVRRCYDSEFFPTDPLCGLFERDFDQRIERVRDSYINIAKQTNRGYDLSLTYRFAPRWGALTLETQHTYQKSQKFALFEDTVRDENGEFGNPKWVGRLNLTADVGRWSAFWGAQVIGSVSNHDSFGGQTATYRGTPYRIVLDSDAVVYHAFSAARQFDGDFTVRLGVRNAFDEKPPRVTTLGLGELDTMGNSAFYSQYDWVARSYYMNLTKRF